MPKKIFLTQASVDFKQELLSATGFIVSYKLYQKLKICSLAYLLHIMAGKKKIWKTPRQQVETQ